jgi:hypothetical protein
VHESDGQHDQENDPYDRAADWMSFEEKISSETAEDEQPQDNNQRVVCGLLAYAPKIYHSCLPKLPHL